MFTEGELVIQYVFMVFMFKNKIANILEFPAVKDPQVDGRAGTRGPGGKETRVWASGPASALLV